MSNPFSVQPCACGQTVQAFRDDSAAGVWVQHGENPEHRRFFRDDDIDASPGKVLLCWVGDRDGWHMQYGLAKPWIDDVHRYEEAA